MGEKRSTQFWIDAFGAEWDYVKRLGQAFSDVEEKKAFWENIKERKLKDPSYSIYDDFPPVKKKDYGIKVCEEILEMLRERGHGKKQA